MAKIIITIVIGIIISLLLMSVGEGEGLLASLAAAIGSLLLGIIIIGIILAIWFFGGAVIIAVGLIAFGLFACIDNRNDSED